MDNEPRQSRTSGWLGFIAIAVSVPLLFVGLNLLLQKIAEVFA